MPDPDPPPSPTHACRRAPPEVWARVRDDYLSGVSAPERRRLHGVGLSALRDRAAREGWQEESLRHMLRVSDGSDASDASDGIFPSGPSDPD